jgi:hypothetical protein
MKTINEIMTYSSFREYSTIMIPIEISSILGYKYFDDNILNKGPHYKALALSPILSTIIYPYRFSKILTL